MYNIILQIHNEFVSESRCIRKLSMIRDDIKIYETKYEDLDKYKDLLLQGAIPVGSVEFTKYCMKLANIKYPIFYTYDNDLTCPYGNYNFYNRNIIEGNKAYFLENIYFINYEDCFIKPKETKLFTGFIFKGFDITKYSSDFELECYNKFITIPNSIELYISEVINIKAEWRCYINKGKLVSVCQYDDSEKDLIPNSDFINKCLEKLGNRTLALDIGLLDSGEYVVIELNDAWAIGKYSGISDNDYFDFIVTRWKEIYETRK